MYDVIVAGAGPVGLLLACELRLAGASVLMLEQADDPHSALKRLPFGMRGLSSPTIEALDRRGLLDELAAMQVTKEDRSAAGAAHWMDQPRRPAGHFAGIQFYQDRVDASKWPYRLAPTVGSSMAVDMQSIEAVLTARALAMGVEIRRGVAVSQVEATPDDVAIRAGEASFRTRWLVGCDGGRSAVRKTAGFEFVGTDPEFTGYSVQVTLADTHELQPGRHYTAAGMYTYSPPGTVTMVDFDGGRFHRSQPITREHVQSVLRRVCGSEVSVNSLSLASTWTDRAFQASSYRKGRVLLAGDAAHTHSPLGGQGLNLGLGDAMNLGWKLAATLRGEAPEDLLDSYSRERHRIGANVLDWSRAQVALMRPSQSSRALEAILRDLIDTGDGATYFAERVSGATLRHDLGGGHPLIGRSAPDFRWADGTRLGERLRSGQALWLDFSGHAPLRALAQHWNHRIAYVAGAAQETLGLSALLVRPDGIVAWAADDAPDLEDAAQAATRWFGKPA